MSNSKNTVAEEEFFAYVLLPTILFGIFVLISVPVSQFVMMGYLNDDELIDGDREKKLDALNNMQYISRCVMAYSVLISLMLGWIALYAFKTSPIVFLLFIAYLISGIVCQAIVLSILNSNSANIKQKMLQVKGLSGYMTFYVITLTLFVILLSRLIFSRNK